MESAASHRPTENSIQLPDIPAIAVNAREAAILSKDGEIKILPHDQARLILHKKPAMVCHAPYTRSRIKLNELYTYDVLELFAFVHPARFATPTIAGLSKFLSLSPPDNLEDSAMALPGIAKALLQDLQNDPHKAKADPFKIAELMGLQGKGWPWTPFIFSALGEEYNASIPPNGKTALAIWKNLPEWAEDAPEPPPSHHAVTGDEARERLKELLGPGAEERKTQQEYTTQLTAAFAPVEQEGKPNIVVAEAGTGIGKTLGYLAPASVWSEKNEGSVWISTYTKNLQRQIDQELDRLYPNPAVKDALTAVRKGRENYLCLLNLEETAAGAALAKHHTTALATGIMARWAAATKDGDLTGIEFPGWLAGLLGYQHTIGLADRRGECIYSACDHYHKCFVERSIRKAKRARLVVANHALVMIQSAISGPGDDMPERYIFDEGHHLFSAADSAYAAHLTARETRDMRRWILGGEGGKRTRARGLMRRAEDLVAGNNEAEAMLQDILMAAHALAADNWSRRLKDGAPSGPCEQFLALIYQQVFARADGRDGPYSLETGTFPLIDGMAERAETLRTALKDIQKPMTKLAGYFRKKLADDDGDLDIDKRKRMEAVASSLERRATMMLAAWISMLESLKTGELNENFVDWMEIERIDGRAIDVGLYRHHVDPMKPFASSLAPHMHGMAVTSATLKDESAEEWDKTLTRTGASYLTPEPVAASFPSPFDYAENSRVFIINDVRKDDMGQVAGAYRSLFEASHGSALGLFTAIQRLCAVHEKIADKLEERGLPLYAQHVDEIDPGTLVDMFRDDDRACLLGTDAIRDGVDVPGESLRLLVFDRVPWPRPTILHKARREHYAQLYSNKRGYDEMITRLKIKQAFGRLIRRADDRGVFVMLDTMFPSRLHNAFPDATPVEKCGLAEACAGIREFLAKTN